ncbi:MFS transporter [Leifsonia sp. NCR5]|uniref:MFS transporter n=1 Tax=Leifsonia sp. NCR5 TaxID=1978342 RepID=UPI000A19A0DC|nr:MFS transporter [Leifsonia sp. NCR5]
MTRSSEAGAGYGRLFLDREFRALWAGSALGTASTSMAGLALGLLVHTETGSAFLTALVVFGPSLAQLFGASALMSAVDTVPPRVLLAASGAAMAIAFTAQAVFDVAPVGRLAIVVCTSVVLSLASGARWGLLADVVPANRYALARSAMNVSVGVMQVVGFALGGVLSVLWAPTAIFWLATGCSAVAALVSWFGIGSHPPRRSGRPGFGATWAANTLLLRQPSTRWLLIALCVPNGLVAGCEALFVSYAPSAAAAFFVAGAAGMLAGDVLMGRVLTERSRRVGTEWLRLLLPVPFLVFVLQPPIPVAAVMVAIGSIGYAASLGQQELLVAVTPHELTGQILGAESSARVAFQGVAAAVAGGLAEIVQTGLAIGLLSLTSIAVSVMLIPGLGRAAHSGPVGQPLLHQ